MNPLSAQLQGKTQAEKVILKSDAIVLAVKKEKILQVGTEIEIVDIQKMDGGVEVFARAWRDGSQIGFGADGSVDIERFRIFNPPLLVDDPTGLIVREGFFDDNCKFLVTNRHLREDPKEALLQVLAKMVGQVGKVGASITPGLIGNTTSTFFSSAGAATPIDGFVQRSLATETWTQTRDGTGNLTNNSGDFQFGQGEFCAACSNRYIINRNVLLFDTSSIPDADSISSASISVTSAATGDSANGDSSNFYSVITAATSSLANADYNIANWGTTAFSTAKGLSTINAAGTYVWTLNASGIANISKTGVSYFGERSTNDASNTTPTLRGYALMRSVDFVGTSSDPFLTVEHATAANGNFFAFM